VQSVELFMIVKMAKMLIELQGLLRSILCVNDHKRNIIIISQFMIYLTHEIRVFICDDLLMM
jgi:hypothetical protein